MSQDIFGVFRGYNPNPEKDIKKPFIMKSPFSPAGDQPDAIKALVQGIRNRERNQILLGVTGSGKTFTMANVIEQVQKTTLILAPNKTLAAQLYSEMKEFFPENAVEYFVSYYDYYRPEAYLPSTNTYVEKEATINEQIERMRHSATRALLERHDVIVVASISCIYGLGAIASYQGLAVTYMQEQKIEIMDLLRAFSHLQYKRNDFDFKRGTFRVRGDRVDIFPAHYEDRAWSFSFFGSEIEAIYEIDVLTGKKIKPLTNVTIYPNNHYVTPGPTLQQAMVNIRQELALRLTTLRQDNKLLEAQRLQERVTYDLESMAATGICAGIENYSCYLTGRLMGEPPPTLFEYLPDDALFIVDESHVAVPQVQGMYLGDASRKKTLFEYGFRLPSCRHNRPLTFDEWDGMRPETIFVSATPGPWELAHTCPIVEQIIRPTGLLDPVCTIHPTEGQIDHLHGELNTVIAQGGRILITTLTKKMSEDLSEYLIEHGFKARYMHADVDTLARIQLIADLRMGIHDILVGINLLREGLDIPECQLVAIFDADKEGYLRSKTALVQTMGRAARHVKGRVILYADKITNAMEQALQETDRRRDIQKAYNEKQGIIPQSAHTSAAKSMASSHDIQTDFGEDTKKTIKPMDQKDQGEKEKSYNIIKDKSLLYEQMIQAAHAMEFEKAASLKKQLQAAGYIF